MTEAESQAMDQFGITSEQKTIYRFRGIAYDRLRDAISYARIVAGREASEAKPLSDSTANDR